MGANMEIALTVDPIAPATPGASHRVRPTPLDWLFRALTGVVALEAVAVAVQIATHPDAPGAGGQGPLGRILLGLIAGPILLLFGGLLLWRVPRNIIGRFLVLFSIPIIGIQFFNDPGSDTPLVLLLEFLIIFGAGIAAPSIGYLMLNFPNGQIYPSAWLPWFRIFAMVKFVGVVLEVLASPRQLKFVALPRNPLYVPLLAPAQPLLGATVGLAGIMLPIIIVAGLASLVLRYRASGATERQQIKWVIWAFIICVLAVLAGIFVVFARTDPLVPVAAIAPVLALGPILMVASMTVAMMRSRLFDIDLILSRTIVYGSLTALIAGFYILAVGVLGWLFQASGSLLISLIATGAIAVLFQPLRERLQRGVNRLIYGERDEPYAVLSKLGQRLESTLEPNAVLPTIVETVAQALRLPYAAIELVDATGRRTEAVYPPGAAHVASDLVRVPLGYGQETIGDLVLAPRGRGESFTPADRRLLEDFARQAGIAAHSVRLANDLQRSRERLVSAREEERRRIRRDLHDGLGPALASLTLKLDAARNLLPRDQAAADRLLVELKAQTQIAIADIRRLVYDLRPPALDELGLVSAVRERLLQYDSSDGLRVCLDAEEPMPPLPAAVELAAYRIIIEGVTNVVRHASAGACVVSLCLEEALEIRVEDNGRGIPGALHAGVGIASMRERAAELGGLLRIESRQGGGTRLLARLPIAN